MPIIRREKCKQRKREQQLNMVTAVEFPWKQYSVTAKSRTLKDSIGVQNIYVSYLQKDCETTKRDFLELIYRQLFVLFVPRKERNFVG